MKSLDNFQVIGGYFLYSIRFVGGIPKTIRSDMGTENKTVENMQIVLHEMFGENDAERPPFMYGKSTHNQRIEAWWSILRKHGAQFWMNLFHMLKEDNHFNGSFIDVSLIQYCFMDTIQVSVSFIKLN